MFIQLSDQIHEAWKNIVGVGANGERDLRAIFVLGTIIAGTEAGFALPRVRPPSFASHDSSVCSLHRKLNSFLLAVFDVRCISGW